MGRGRGNGEEGEGREMGKRGEEGREGSVSLQFLPVPPPHFLIPGVAPEETRLE